MEETDLYYPPGAPGDNNGVQVPNWFINRDLPNEELDVLIIERASKSAPLAVTFGGCGINPDTGRAQYGMQNFLKDSLINQICVRDQYGCWYHNGISGASTNVATTVEYLRSLIDDFQATRVLCSGSSAGAYSAILFGTLLNATGVVALNPQTLLKRGVKCQAHGHLYALQWTDGEGSWDFSKNQQYADLLDLPPSDVKIELVYGQDCPVDTFHAERMRAFPNIHVEPVPGTHGTAIIQTRDNGMLAQLFGDVFYG